MKHIGTFLFISPHNGIYGAERSMIAIAKGLKNHKKKVLIIIPQHGPIEDLLNTYKIPYKILYFKNWINTSGKNRNIIGYIKLFINYFQAIRLHFMINDKINLVHTNSIVTPFGCQFAKLYNIPHIQHIREFADRDFNMHFDIGKQNALKFVSQCSEKIICISNMVMQNFFKYGDHSKYEVVYNGITYNIQHTNRINDKTLRIVMVGRLSNEKRQIDLIEAARLLLDNNLKDFKIDFYGNGILEKEYKRKCCDYQLNDYISFLGFSDNINLNNYDIGIMASPFEAFGRVTIEYMAAGLAIIGCNSGATKEIIKNNENGLLFFPQNSHELYLKIKQLYENKHQISLLGKNAKSTYLNNFTEDIYLKHIFSLYNDVLKI